MYKLDCLKCDKEFESRSRYNKYCSDCGPKKRTVEKTKRVKMVTEVVKDCSVCNKKFTAKWKGSSYTSVCPKCAEDKRWWRVAFKGTKFL